MTAARKIAVNPTTDDSMAGRTMADILTGTQDPAWIFADPRFRGQNAEAFSTKFLDLGCATARARCLQVGTLERWLSRRRTHFSVVNIGSFTVVRPGRPTSAAAVLSSNHLS